MTGGIEVVNMKLLALLRMQSISVAFPTIYPPKQPKAFPKVPEIKSTISETPSY